MGHGKRKYLAAKKKYVTAKENILSVRRKNRRQEKIAHYTATGNLHGTFRSNNAEDDPKYPLCWKVSRVQIKDKEQAKAYKKSM